MTTYAGAVPVTSVVCPPWCQVPQQEHLDELDDWEGRCIHYSRGTWENERCSNSQDSQRQPLWWVDHASETFADGTPDTEERNAPCVHLEAHNPLNLDEAEAYARAILAAVEEARS